MRTAPFSLYYMGRLVDDHNESMWAGLWTPLFVGSVDENYIDNRHECLSAQFNFYFERSKFLWSCLCFLMIIGPIWFSIIAYCVEEVYLGLEEKISIS